MAGREKGQVGVGRTGKGRSAGGREKRQQESHAAADKGKVRLGGEAKGPERLQYRTVEAEPDIVMADLSTVEGAG